MGRKECTGVAEGLRNEGGEDGGKVGGKGKERDEPNKPSELGT